MKNNPKYSVMNNLSSVTLPKDPTETTKKSHKKQNNTFVYTAITSHKARYTVLGENFGFKHFHGCQKTLGLWGPQILSTLFCS